MKLTDKRIEELWHDNWDGFVSFEECCVIARAIEEELEKEAPDSFDEQESYSFDAWLDECDESGSTIEHRIECAGLNEIMSWVERAFAAGRDSVEQAPRWISMDEQRLPMARSLTDELMDCVDRLGSEADSVDPRVWEHLLVYAPKLEKQAPRWHFGEATPAMCLAGFDAIKNIRKGATRRFHMSAVWAAMYAAMPAPPAAQGGEGGGA